MVMIVIKFYSKIMVSLGHSTLCEIVLACRR